MKCKILTLIFLVLIVSNSAYASTPNWVYTGKNARWQTYVLADSVIMDDNGNAAGWWIRVCTPEGAAVYKEKYPETVGSKEVEWFSTYLLVKCKNGVYFVDYLNGKIHFTDGSVVPSSLDLTNYYFDGIYTPEWKQTSPASLGGLAAKTIYGIAVNRLK